MELYTLSLHRALRYASLPVASASVAEALALLSGAEEGILVLDGARAVALDPANGPDAAADPGKPLFAGTAVPTVAGDGSFETAAGAGERATVADEEGKNGVFAVGEGSYAFLQTKCAGPGELRDALSFFVRESWWEGKEGQGPILVRILSEDGTRSLQILRRLTT
jgi:hypothetical protein